MGQYHLKHGDYVGIEFNSADASTAAAITLKDADQVTRTLQPYERLLIDEVTAVLAAGVTGDLFDDKNANGNVDAGERIMALGALNSRFDGGHEGYSVSLGSTPKVKTSGAGVVNLTGTGRIIIGQSQGIRPKWQSSLVPGQ